MYIKINNNKICIYNMYKELKKKMKKNSTQKYDREVRVVERNKKTFF